jgi:type II secretory pathway component PulJ
MIRMNKEMLKVFKNAEGRTGKFQGTSPMSAGLTLVELIVVMILSLVLVGSAFTAYLAHNKTSGEQGRVVALQQDLRAVMDIIERDVKNSGCHDPRLAAVIPAITGANSGPSSIAMNMDLNLDGEIINTTGERVTYWRSGGAQPYTLNKTDQTTVIPLLTNVTTFGIIYRGVTDNTITPAGTLTQTQANSVLSVIVTLGIRSTIPDPDTGRPVTRTITRRMQSRNQEIALKGF